VRPETPRRLCCDQLCRSLKMAELFQRRGFRRSWQSGRRSKSQWIDALASPSTGPAMLSDNQVLSGFITKSPQICLELEAGSIGSSLHWSAKIIRGFSLASKASIEPPN